MLDLFAQLFQHCWATHAHYTWLTKTYGLYSSHDALQVPTLLGVVASVCTPLPTRTQQLPTLLAQQCWELFRPFARCLKLCATTPNNTQQHATGCANGRGMQHLTMLGAVGQQCCVRLHGALGCC